MIASENIWSRFRIPLHSSLDSSGTRADTLTQNKTEFKTLTEIEEIGLRSKFNLADGHSYFDADRFFKGSIQDFPKIWRHASETSVPTMELEFKQCFADFFGTPGLSRQKSFSICPTASNSIDIFAAFAKSKDLRVGLIEPTFDNLALILKRRGVDLISVPEQDFFSMSFANLRKTVLRERIDCLFLVHPNNPTGRSMSQQQFEEICLFCKELGILVCVDTCFRFCQLSAVDEYAAFQKLGNSYVVIEDTGKLWPTLDSKASILAYSEDLATEIRTIYEEIYLCSSNLTLALIIDFMRTAQKMGGVSLLHDFIKKRAEFAISNLTGTALRYIPNLNPTQMSVLCFDCSQTGMDDLEFTQYLARHNLIVLPGRYFYWDSMLSYSKPFVRVSLLKDDQSFYRSIVLLKYLSQKPRVSSLMEELCH